MYPLSTRYYTNFWKYITKNQIYIVLLITELKIKREREMLLVPLPGGTKSNKQNKTKIFKWL